jgi:PAS domain S-box-containing protein
MDPAAAGTAHKDSSRGAVPSVSSVLVVDNDPEVREALCAGLELVGMPCTACADPVEALDEAGRRPPALALSDLHMPVMDGVEFCRRLRQIAGCDETVVILMTTDQLGRQQHDEEIVRGLEAGANDYILKPFGVGEVLARVRAWLRTRSAQENKSELARRFASALALSEAKYRTMLEQASDGIVLAGPDGCILETNPRFAAMIGMSADEITGRRISEIVGPVRIRTPDALSGEEPGRPAVEQRALLRPDGGRVPVEIASRVLSDGRLLAILRDITGRHDGEEACRALVEASLQGLLLLQDRRVVFANRGMMKLTGRPVTELLAMTAEELAATAHPKDRSRFLEHLAGPAAGGNGSPRQCEIRVVRPDGSLRRVNAIASAVEYRDRPAVHLAEVDITEQRAAEDELRRSEERLRILFDGAQDGVMLADPVTRQLSTNNRRMRQMLGYTEEELRGMRVDDLHPPAAVAEVLAQFERQARGEMEVAADCPVRHKDGSVFYADISANLVMLQGQSLLVGVFRDITGRRQRQEERRDYAERLEAEVAERTRKVRSSEELYRALFENVAHAVIVTDLLGTITNCNPAAEGLLRAPRADLVGKDLARTFLAASWPGAADQLIPEVLRSGTAVRECTLHAAAGRQVPVNLSVASLQDLDGRPEGMIWILGDLSERERLTEEAWRARKYAAEVLRSLTSCGELVGQGEAFKRVLAFVGEAARCPATVLLQGESGSGKEAVARAIHAQGQRADRPFVVVDCAAIKGSLLESELFGHEKGAFTGAGRTRHGLIEVAEGGSLFLDEIGEIPVELQAKLLRVIEGGEYRRLGSTQTRRADIRIMAATNRDLTSMIRQGTFRADLFFRLNVLSLVVPPLRQRLEDIPLLARHFLKLRGGGAGESKRFRQDTMRLLVAHRWPGNIRELGNVVERAVFLTGKDPVLKPSSLPPELQPAGSADGAARVRSIADAEREAIEAALAATGGNRTQAARLLGISAVTLRHKLRAYGTPGKAENATSAKFAGSD